MLNLKFIIVVLSLTYSVSLLAQKAEYEVVMSSEDKNRDLTQEILDFAKKKEKIGDYYIRPCGWEPALFVDTYYDDKDYSMYKNRSALRSRIRYKDTEGRVLRDAFFESKVGKQIEGVKGFSNEETTGAEYSDVEDFIGDYKKILKKGSDDAALQVVRNEITDKKLNPLMQVKNKRTFLCASKSKKGLPAFSLTLDDIRLQDMTSDKQIRYPEVEIQISNMYPLVDRVNDKNIAKLEKFAEEFREHFNLTDSSFTKYKHGIETFFTNEDGTLKEQKIPEETKKRKINVDAKYVTLIDNKLSHFENPALSDDGKNLAVIGSFLRAIERSSIFPYVYEKDENGCFQRKKGSIAKSKGRAHIGASFKGENNEMMYTSIRKYLGRYGIAFYSKNKKGKYKQEKIMYPEDFGFDENVILNHPKMSPDGNWLTFYTRDTDKRGIHLYNIKQRKQ